MPMSLMASSWMKSTSLMAQADSLKGWDWLAEAAEDCPPPLGPVAEPADCWSVSPSEAGAALFRLPTATKMWAPKQFAVRQTISFISSHHKIKQQG